MRVNAHAAAFFFGLGLCRAALSGGSSAAGSAGLPRMKSAARSPIITHGALVLPPITLGITEASAMRRPSIPFSRSWGSTTSPASEPMRQVPTGWWTV